MRATLPTLLFCVLAPLATAQQHAHESTPAAGKAPMLSGLGDMHHKVSTRIPEAQRYFDQGLVLIYAFNHDEAARSFRQAAELDPTCAMAWWGVALAVGPNYNMPDVDPEHEQAAIAAIQKALSLAAKSSPEEQAYIQALAKRIPLDPKADRKLLGPAYRDAMADLKKRFPEDPDAAVLYADSIMNIHPWQLWTPAGQPEEGTLAAIDALQSVLTRYPNHIGANHFLIHATEASPHPEQASASAQRLKTLAPAAGHLVHMPAHVYIRVGDYHAASEANQQAAAADKVYVETYHVTGMYPAMYFTHNLHFLAVSAAMEGRFATASDAARDVEQRAAPYAKDMPMAEAFVPTPVFILVRFHKWASLRTLPEPDAALRIAHAFWRFGQAMALTGEGKIAEATAERAKFAAEVEGVPADAPFGFNTAHQILDLAGGLLDGSLARAQGDYQQAAKVLSNAAKLEDALHYDEPPDWYIPPRESLGAVLFQAGRHADAEAEFRAELKNHPKNPRALFGLAECLEARGNIKEASRIREEFTVVWKYADVKLTIAEL